MSGTFALSTPATTPYASGRRRGAPSLRVVGPIAAIVAALAILAAFAATFSYFDAIGGLSRGSEPGTVATTVDGGRVVVYYEGRAALGLADLGVRVTGPDGSAVAVESYPYTLEYDVNRRAGHAVAAFEATAPGHYVVSASVAEPGARLAVGRDLGMPTVLMVAAVIAGLFVLAIDLIAVVAVALLNRGAAYRAA